MLLGQQLFSGFLGAQCTSAIDVAADLGHIAEDADRGTGDLHEATMHRHIEDGTVDEGDAGVILREGAEERRMTRQERDLAATEGAGDDL